MKSVNILQTCQVHNEKCTHSAAGFQCQSTKKCIAPNVITLNLLSAPASITRANNDSALNYQSFKNSFNLLYEEIMLISK
jgi:hypothetical protein